MSMVVNERDLLLRAASVRDTDPRAGKAILLSADAPLFRVDVAGGGLPATISLRAQLVNIKGTVQWTVVGVQGVLNVEADSLVATLAYAQVLADTVEVTASVTENGQQYSAVQRIQRIKEGVQGQSTAQLYAYKRAVTAPSDKPGDVTYDFAAKRITQPATDALANGWSKTIPAGTDPLYVSVASASGFLAADNVAAAEWSGAVLLAQNGAKGLNTATVFIYQRTASATPPALPAASTTYTFADGALAGLNNGWSRTIPSSGGAFLHISQATAASTEATDTIPAGEWSASLLATDGASGQSQAMVYAYKRAVAAPSDNPGAVTFTFAAGAITAPAGNALANGWSKTIPAGTDALYVAAASAVGSGAADSIGAGEWATPVLFSQNGLNGATVYIYQRTTTMGAPPLPALPATYTFENGVLTGLNNGWSTRVPDDVGGDYLYVATATAASAGVSDTIGPGEWAVPQLMAKNGSNAKVISLGATSQIFQVSKSGAASPSSVTVSARAQNLTGSPVWTVVAGTATLSAGANPFEKVISYADLATDYATIQVSCDGQTDKMTVAKVREGMDAVVAVLSNEAHTLPCDVSGNVLSTVGASTTMTLYSGTANVTSLYTFAYGPASSGSSVVYSASTNTLTINGMAAYVDSGYVDITASRAGYPDVVKRFTLSKSKTGAQGNPGYPGQDGDKGDKGDKGDTGDKGDKGDKGAKGDTGNPGSPGGPGPRGSVRLVGSGYSAWTDNDAVAVLSNKGYFFAVNGDIVTLTNGSTFTMTKFYSFNVWYELTEYIDGNLLVSGTLSASKVNGGELKGVEINIGSGNFWVRNVDGNVHTSAAFLGGCRAAYDNAASPVAPTLSGKSRSASYAGVHAEGTVAIKMAGRLETDAMSGNSGQAIFNGIAPKADNSYNCGEGNYRWATIYAMTGAIQTSDERDKQDIENLNEGLDFIKNLRPVQYRWKVSQNEVVDDEDFVGPSEGLFRPTRIVPKLGTRLHYGFLAQEVQQALGAKDVGLHILVDKNDPASRQGLRYDELLAPVVKAIQQLSAMVEEQAALISTLQHKISILTSQ